MLEMVHVAANAWIHIPDRLLDLPRTTRLTNLEPAPRARQMSVAVPLWQV